LNPNHESEPAGPRAIGCDVVGYATVRAPLAAVAELRRHPGPPLSAALPATFLKHADEQTVVGLSAIFHAIAAHGLRDVSFRDWGVVAAPRFLARSMMITTLQRFLAEGAWGVSPHMIPHRSLHSISGTISHALKINGPNFGVGGGHGGAVEVLLAAVALLDRMRLPGLWVVWTAQEPDGEMDLAGHGDPATVCRALAVALAPALPECHRLRLQLEVGHGPGACTENDDEQVQDYFYLETLLNRLGAAHETGRKVVQDLGAGIRVGLQWPQRFSARANGAAAGASAVTAQSPFPPAGAEIKR
jgi:hypothetical protein